jgi:hypothetical protein
VFNPSFAPSDQYTKGMACIDADSRLSVAGTLRCISDASEDRVTTRSRAACTAPKFGVRAMTCCLASRAHAPGSRFIGSSSALSDRDPGVRLARAAGPRAGVQGHRDHGGAARSGGTEASGHPAEPRLGRPGGPGGAGPDAASRSEPTASSHLGRCWPGSHLLHQFGAYANQF